MIPVKIFFLFGYYIKKHLLKNVCANDIFLKRFFRFAGKVPGKVIKRSEREILYSIEGVNGKRLHLFIRGGASSDVMAIARGFLIKNIVLLYKRSPKGSNKIK